MEPHSSRSVSGRINGESRVVQQNDGKAQLRAAAANGHPHQGGYGGGGALHQYQTQGIKGLSAETSGRLMPKAITGMRTWRVSMVQQHWLRMGQNPGQIPESAAQAVGKGLENHHTADIGGENARSALGKSRPAIRAARIRKGHVICNPIVKLLRAFFMCVRVLSAFSGRRRNTSPHRSG